MFLNFSSLHSQSAYLTFRTAVRELHTEYQAKKNSFQEAYIVSKAKVASYTAKVPEPLVLGHDYNLQIGETETETDISVVEGVDLSLAEEDIPPPSMAELKDKNVGVPAANKSSFYYTSQPMFPGEPQGLTLTPRTDLQEPGRRKWQFTFLPTILDSIKLADVKDPVQQQKWKDYETHESNVSSLNRVTLVQALDAGSTSRNDFFTLLDEMDLNGYSLPGYVHMMHLSPANNKVEEMKKWILISIDQMLRK